MGEQGLANLAVLDDVAKRMRGNLCVAVLEEEERGPVRHPDIEDGLGQRLECGPEADAGERLDRAPGDRRGAAVKGAFALMLRARTVEDGDLDAGTRQGRGEGEADHAAAHDQHLGTQDALGSCSRRFVRACHGVSFAECRAYVQRATRDLCCGQVLPPQAFGRTSQATRRESAERAAERERGASTITPQARDDPTRPIVGRGQTPEGQSVR